MEYFTSDYLEGCHPKVLEALTRTNLEQTPGYGLDPHCEAAAAMIRKRFQCPGAAVHFLTGGTQANLTVIASILQPYEGVLCADTAHINTHETGAIEATGHKVLTLPGRDGIILGSQVSIAAALQGDWEHTVRPGMVYISMSTELGTIYDLSTLSDLYHVRQDNGLYLYIDGARLGAGLMSPICDIQPEELAGLCDVFTVGGTKNGALFGEAVVIVNPALQKRFRYMMKQRGGLLAKGRLLGVQFEALMQDDLYFTIAKHAVDQAMLIRDALLEQEIPLYVDASANQLFPVLTDDQLEAIEEDFVLETWERVDEKSTAVRICTSWATRPESVQHLIETIRKL